MSETAAPKTENETARPSQLHLVETQPPSYALLSPQASAWALLFGALAASAGHGVFLTFALTQLERIPNLAELGGPPNALVVGWFVASIPGAIAAFFGRRKLAQWPSARLQRVAYFVLAMTVVTFALYVRKMVIA